MTDPRINPAGSPGTQGGETPPQGSGGSGRSGRHGLFHWGRHGSDSQSTAGGVGTATRTTPSTSVPQQSSQPAAAPAQPQTAPAQPQEYQRTEYAEYAYGESMYGPTSESQNLIAKAAKQSWAVVAVGSLGLIALGIMLLVWPNLSLTIVAILIGAALCVAGAVRLYEGFTAHGGESGGMRVAYIVVGLLAVILGVYLLRHHALSLFLLAFVTGVYFITQGIAEIGASASAASGRGLRVVLGIFSIAAGLVLVIWPSISLVLLFLIMGAWLLFYGLVLGGLALSMRKAAKGATARSTQTTAARARAA
jgi:uncharacterized membrane protein HdeD (DUF308 family)